MAGNDPVDFMPALENMVAAMQATAEVMRNQMNYGNGNNGEEGPMTLATLLKKRKKYKAGRAQQPGRVFGTSAAGAEGFETLIRDNYEVADKILNALFDSGVTYSFIAFEKASELGLKIVVLTYDLKVHNATFEAIVTRLGYPQVSFRVKQRDFIHDLICLPITGLDLILGLDWLSKNRILLDFFERLLHFMTEGSEGPVVMKGYYLNSVIVNYNGCEYRGVMLLAVNVSGEE
ncbi:uncharacterized protein LOC107606839 [Arachis ipaensis]|uniref:uncharacterized protein LOC107606839 n=1 Tax=Arachis ipaensis TaxID=130454 RepID=UPI0007AF3D69|nr:uncharacterized protein LOC107606839 [Arachis ipaensis]